MKNLPCLLRNRCYFKKILEAIFWNLLLKDSLMALLWIKAKDLLISRIFTFRYPLRSLRFGCNGHGGNAGRGTAVDDAVLSDNRESSHAADVAVVDEAENLVGLEGQNGNWVLKILHLRTGTKDEEHQEGDNNGEGMGIFEKDLVAHEETDCSLGDDEVLEDDGDNEEEWCGACRVDFDEQEKEIEIDRDTFSSLLHRVSLDQAKLYAKMAYLGNLAYTISEIKVHCLTLHSTQSAIFQG